MQKIKLKDDYLKHKKGDEIIVGKHEAELLFRLKKAEKPKKELTKSVKKDD